MFLKQKNPKGGKSTMGTLSLQELADKTLEALKEAGSSNNYQRVFQTVSRQLILYAANKDIQSFSMDLGLQFLEDHYSMSEKIQEKKFNYQYLRSINAMSEYQQKGSVILYLAKDMRNYSFPEAFKDTVDDYLAYRRSIGFKEKSVRIFSLYLERFCAFLDEKGIRSLDDISIRDVYAFMDSLSSCYEKPTINHTMRAVRYYLKYCHDNQLMAQELFSRIPNPHYNRQSRIPSVYSEEEVRKLLSCIDQGNPCGLRNYSIILLITRLGLRSSDVANLRFSNIDWENERISFTQVKTGNPLELPLLEDVGESIIHYLQNGRPQTDSDHVFVRQIPPYTEFQPGCVGGMVRTYLQKAGIRVEGRKKGSHTLRHSLASRLLEHEIPLPVISEILGHTTTQTTMTYLRIDMSELKKCALEVTF